MAKKAEVRIVSRADVLLGAVEKELKRKVTRMGYLVHEKLTTQVLVGERSGRWYRVPKTNRMYQASVPGEPPASRLGDLRRSYRVNPVEGKGTTASVKVGSPLTYAAHLEGDRMNRKHLEPAVRLAEPQLVEIVTGDWQVK